MFKIKKVNNPKAVSDTLDICCSAWAWYLEAREFWWFVVFNSDNIWVAYGALSVYNKDTLYLGPDHVIKEMRGLGLQSKLIVYRERWARRQGYKKLICIVAHDNIYSANNFIKRGWLLRKPWPGCEAKNNYLYFEKIL